MRLPRRPLIIGALVLAGTVASTQPAAAQAQDPACTEAEPAVQFDGLSRRLAVGREAVFQVASTEADDTTVSDVRMVMRDKATRKPFFSGEVDLEAAQDYSLELERGDGPVEVVVSYTTTVEPEPGYEDDPAYEGDPALDDDPEATDEEGPAARVCRQEIRRTVRPRSASFLPGTCQTPEERPRLVVIACGDGGYRLRISWNRWGGAVASGRGRGIVNTCDPSCAAGHFRSYRATFRASRLRRCPDVGYQYTRLRVRYRGARPRGESRTVTWRFGCAGYPDRAGR